MRTKADDGYGCALSSFVLAIVGAFVVSFFNVTQEQYWTHLMLTIFGVACVAAIVRWLIDLRKPK